VFAHDPTDGVIGDMHAGFVAISNQIAAELSRLVRSIAAAPAHVQTSVLAAANRIALTQQRLRREWECLPVPPEQRIAVMRTLLQAQQGALKHLAIIVEQQAPRPRRALSGHPTPPVAGARGLVQGPSALAHAMAVARQVHADPLSDHPWRRHTPLPMGARQRRSRARGQWDISDAHRRKPSSLSLTSLVKGAASRSLALVAMIAAGLLVAYGTFPRASQNETPPPAASERAHAAPAAEAAPSSALPSPAAAISPPAPSLFPEREDAGGAMGGLAAHPRAAAADPVAAALEPPHTMPIAIPAPVRAKSEGGGEQFVPVVFTHKEKEAATRTFRELQAHFPKLLRGRQGEAQAIDTVRRGLWYRLLVLPPGPRQQAADLCEHLRAAGYDRCWVKAY
jgi:hypothetical protein